MRTISSIRSDRPLSSTTAILIATVLIVATAAILYVAALATTRHIGHHHHLTSPNLPSAPATTPPVSAPTPLTTTDASTARAVASCQNLLIALGTLNWQQPSLSAAELTQWASPTLANQLAAVFHLTPGQIATHINAPATVQIDFASPTKVTAELTEHLVEGPVVSNWTCNIGPDGKVTEVAPQ
jgi:hypothetical protein